MQEKPVISLCASATRVRWWPRFLESLKGNKTPYEVVFCGNVKPDFDTSKYPELKYIYATVKPAQCYEIAFRAAIGDLIHWTADDASYGDNPTECNNPLDIAYEKWIEIEQRNQNDRKTVIAMNPCEDGGYPQAKFHRFFGGWEHTPVMAPFALLDRNYFVNKLGGYDKRFVSGQSENDVVMRVFEDGGRVEMCLDSKLYVHHRQVHPRDPNTGKEDNKFRKWYNTDRDVLEELWVVGGRGWYEKINQMPPGPARTNEEKKVPISPKRLSPLEKFEDENICTVTQGLKGHWL